LAVGNFLNANNKKGEANGVRLDVLTKIEGLRSNDNGWNLLMYVYNLMTVRFPDFVDLHSDLSAVPDAAKVCKEEELEDLKKQVEDINNQVKDMIQKMDNIRQAVNAPPPPTESKTENEEEEKPKDRFLEVMEVFVQEAKKSADELQQKLNTSLENLTNLAVSFGENKELTMQDFMKYFTDFLEAWGKSREALRKIEAEKKKREKMDAKKNKLEAKLVKRESKQALQDKGVLKSKKKAKQEKQQKKLVENVLTKEINEKKKKIIGSGRQRKKTEIVNSTSKYICTTNQIPLFTLRRST